MAPTRHPPEYKPLLVPRDLSAFARHSIAVKRIFSRHGDAH